MSDDTPTRRTVLRTSAALVGLGAVAGCSGLGASGESGTDTPAGDESVTTTAIDESGTATATASGATATETGTETSTETGTESATETPTTTGPYTVSIEPVGEVTFESVPETWVANNGSWADMGVALGRDPPAGVWLPSRYHTRYYDEIPGVDVDADGMTALYQDGVSKEVFYELDGDVHVMDPNFLIHRFDWSADDVAEIEEQVGPFFGNSSFSTGYGWHEDYRYYSLYGAFEKLAAAFRERDRYEAFAALHEDFQSSLDDIVSGAHERPAVAIAWAAGDEPDEFLPYLIGDGTSFKQWRDLDVTDALAETDVQDFHETRGSIDYETMLEIDPEYLMLRGHEHQTREEFEGSIVAYMEDHDVASALTAVAEGNVYRGGPLYQGPITNLVVTERAARQVYDVDDRLFDRERVADIVAGDV